MLNTNRHRLYLIATLASALALVAGCAVETTEDVGTLQQGLTVLEADVGVLSMAYRDGDDVIYMEALRGQPTADIYREDPEMPAFEVDARFTSDDGRTFFSARGGDHWLDPSWLEALESQNAEQPSGSNEHLFRLATDASAVMNEELEEQVGAERVAQLGPEIHAIYGFAVQALDEYREQNRNFLEQIRENGDAPTLIDEETGDVAYGGDKGGPDDPDWATDANGYYALGVHDKGIYCFLGICGGRHSATQLLYWSNGWVTVHNNCNHGECAYGMGVKCYLQYYDSWDSDYYVTGRMYQQSCDSNYDWASNSHHNCHDDTRNQMYNKVSGNTIGGWEYWCNDGDSSADISSINDNTGSPECNAGTRRGYIHPWM